MDKRTKRAFIIAAILFVFFLLYPKYAGHGYGGLVRGNMTVYRMEYSCLGAEYTTQGDRWGIYTVSDAGPSYYCIGIPYDPKCYARTSGTPMETEVMVSCARGG